MTPLRCLALLLFTTTSACDKPQPTETPTTATPDDSAGAGDASVGDASVGDASAGEVPGECKPTGCSGIVCSDAEVMTTCEYKPEYACYKTATCTRQEDGACGWTPSPDLDACLANPPAE